MPSTGVLFVALVVLSNSASVFGATLERAYMGVDTNIENTLFPGNADEGKFSMHKAVPVAIHDVTLDATLSHMHKTRMNIEDIWPREPIQSISSADKKSPAHRLQPMRRAVEYVFDTLKKWFGIHRLIACYHRRAAIRNITKAIDFEVKAVKDYKEGKETEVECDVREWIDLIEKALWHQRRAASAGNGKIKLLAYKDYVDRRMRRIMFAQENGVYYHFTGKRKSPVKWEDDEF